MKAAPTTRLGLLLLVGLSIAVPVGLGQDAKTPPNDRLRPAITNVDPAVRTAEVRFIATSTEGQPISAIKSEELVLTEHGESRKIISLEGGPESPLTIGFLFDVSGSRHADSHAAVERNLARELLGKIWHEGDLAFVIGFKDDLLITAKPTTILREAEDGIDRIADIPLHGSTSLFDAICAADPARLARRPGRKALVILTDGEDNSSRNTLVKALECAHIGGVQVFFILLGPRFSGERPILEKRARRTALQLTQQTGGAPFEPKNLADLPSIFEKLRWDLGASYRARYGLQSENPKGRLDLSLAKPGTNVIHSVATVTVRP